jgi:hypothetical protein
VLCGDDPRATGEGLLALWEEGLDQDGRVPGPRGRLASDLDPAAIDELRGDVRLLDVRDDQQDVLVAAIRALPTLSALREAAAVPDRGAVQRKVFLSRKTSFPIFTSDVADGWLQLLNLALRIGTDKRAGDGEPFAEALNAVVTIDTPVLEDGEHEARDEFPGFLDFTRDDFEQRYFPRYGADQLEAARDRLHRSTGAHSATIAVPAPDELADEGNAPDLLSVTFNVVEERLFTTSVLRRCDLYTDWPLEATALYRIQHDLADRLGLEVGSATFVIHSAYLREADFERSRLVLEEHFTRPLPLHVDPSGVFLFGSDSDGARAMLLNHDASEIFWEDAFADPEDLSWYIVDMMPWLLPQHIRYVGQECAALMRAMQAGECYLQG